MKGWEWVGRRFGYESPVLAGVEAEVGVYAAEVAEVARESFEGVFAVW